MMSSFLWPAFTGRTEGAARCSFVYAGTKEKKKEDRNQSLQVKSKMILLYNNVNVRNAAELYTEHGINGEFYVTPILP